MPPVSLPLRTERLTLRPLEMSDRDDLLAYFSRRDVVRYLYGEPHTEATITELLQRRTALRTMERRGDRLSLAVVPDGVGRVVGDLTLSWFDDPHLHAEIGFVFHPDHHGRGYATEAARELLRVSFDVLGLHRVSGTLDARNDPSAAVFERLGMRREGLMLENELVKGEWTDEMHYAMLDREWRAAARRMER